jgi:GT2 family glycosyltransferase
MAPKVSIIIPAYNRAHLIGATLRSALRQTYTDYEIVVVDDGSTDDTESVVRSIAPMARYISQANVGIPEVLNVCVRAAAGEYIAFLGSDDALAPKALEKQAAVLDANPTVGIVHGQAWLIDEQGTLTELQKPAFATQSYVRSGREEIEDLLMSNHIVATTVMVRKQCFDDVGYFDGRFGLYEDWNMWTRIFKQWDAGYVHEPLAFYRVHHGKSGSIFKKAAPRKLESYRRIQVSDILNDPDIGPQVRHLRRRSYARHHYTVAMHSLESGARWYGRWHALRAVLWGLPADGTSSSALRVLFRSFLPKRLIDFVRRRKHADMNAPANGTTLEAVLGGAVIPGAK